jgi:hypothetical protein
MRAILLPVLVLAACRQPDPPAITAAWSDGFERDRVGGDYVATDNVYQIEKGALTVSRAFNHPLWLRKRLPDNAVIEVDVRSDSAAGDIKVEAWGDGESYARDRGAYTSTGYVFIMGGWSNSKSMIAKGNEHGRDVVERVEPKVEAGRTYHWKIVRKGGHVEWYVDDMTTPFLVLEDASPYAGKGHAYFGFNDWESILTFDNLSVTPL